MSYLHRDGKIDYSFLMKRANLLAKRNYRIDRKLGIIKPYSNYLSSELKEEYKSIHEAIWSWNQINKPVYKINIEEEYVSNEYIISVSKD